MNDALCPVCGLSPLHAFISVSCRYHKTKSIVDLKSVLEAYRAVPQPAGSDSLNKEQGESSTFSSKEFAVFVATYVDTSLKHAAKLFRDDSIKIENPKL